MSRTGQGALGEVRDGSGEARGGLGRFGGLSGRCCGTSRKFGTGLGKLMEV